MQEDTVFKSDTQLRQDILDELRWDPAVSESEIGIAVKGGVVTLSGYVESYAQKYAAERDAERVSGVRALADDLKVKLPSSREKTDTEIAHAVANALTWDSEIPPGAIKARVDGGWVRLDGTVEWQYQKSAAERAVRYLAGVKGVANQITLQPKKVSPLEVTQKIREALRRSAEVDASKIQVEAFNGEVTLRGSVRSWAERQDAERAAWAAPGVTLVNDLLAISSSASSVTPAV
jgi:osmotically-inducible protein OsmY